MNRFSSPNPVENRSPDTFRENKDKEDSSGVHREKRT